MSKQNKRVTFKDIVTPPLNWKAPNTVSQESESVDSKKDQEEQGSDK